MSTEYSYANGAHVGVSAYTYNGHAVGNVFLWGAAKPATVVAVAESNPNTPVFEDDCGRLLTGAEMLAVLNSLPFHDTRYCGRC